MRDAQGLWKSRGLSGGAGLGGDGALPRDGPEAERLAAGLSWRAPPPSSPSRACLPPVLFCAAPCRESRLIAASSASFPFCPRYSLLALWPLPLGVCIWAGPGPGAFLSRQFVGGNVTVLGGGDLSREEETVRSQPACLPGPLKSQHPAWETRLGALTHS